MMLQQSTDPKCWIWLKQFQRQKGSWLWLLKDIRTSTPKHSNQTQQQECKKRNKVYERNSSSRDKCQWKRSAPLVGLKALLQ